MALTAQRFFEEQFAINMRKYGLNANTTYAWDDLALQKPEDRLHNQGQAIKKRTKDMIQARLAQAQIRTVQTDKYSMHRDSNPNWAASQAVIPKAQTAGKQMQSTAGQEVQERGDGKRRGK